MVHCFRRYGPFLLLFIILLPASVVAKTGIITGTTRDSTGKTPLAGAVVYALTSSGALTATALSDGVGAFRFEELPTGPYSLVISHPNHQMRRIDGVQVRDGETKRVDAFLAPIAITTKSETRSGLIGLGSNMLALIIVFSLVALLTSLGMVYFYINKVRTTAIHRRLLSDMVLESMKRRIGGQIPAIQVPREVEDLEYIERDRRRALHRLERDRERLQELKNLIKLTAEQKGEMKELEREIRAIESDLTSELSEDALAKLRERKRELERKRRERDDDIKRIAESETKNLVPDSLTVAGMGITGSFFIELTAILTIIFGIIILGLVGVLVTEQIAPILAAIAGYVLGKTTSGWAPYGGGASLQQPQEVPAPTSMTLRAEPTTSEEEPKARAADEVVNE